MIPGGVLIYKNFPTEGPGLIADLLDRHGLPYTVAERSRGQPLDWRRFEAVVVLGGPQSANDKDAKTRQILEALRGIVRARQPLLGICLGAQMVARALGAPVTRSPAPEYGHSMVRLTLAARRDPLFRGVPSLLPVFQWHGEAFGLPREGQLLARGAVCTDSPLPTGRGRYRRGPRGAWRAREERQHNQAFRVGRAWGLQFHNEVTPAMVERWARLGAKELRRAGVESREMVQAYRLRAEAIARAGEKMAEGFLRAARLV